MTRTRSTMVLNRPVFTQHRFASFELTVLSTLIHRFGEAGTYQVTVTGGGQTRTDSLNVSTVGSHQQVNIDMSQPGNAAGAGFAAEGANGCCCEPAAGRDLAVGGVVAFYASAGTGSYQVSVTNLGEREKRVVLDSAKTVPQGDYFAVTLVRPGSYRMVDELSRAEAQAHVSIPERERIDTQHVAMLKLGEGGFEPSSVRLHSGQSIFVECGQEARLLVELLDSEDSSVATRSGKHTFRRPRPRPRG